MHKLMGKQVKIFIDDVNKHDIHHSWQGRVGVVAGDPNGECVGEFRSCVVVAFDKFSVPFFLDELRYLNNHKVVL